MLGKTDFLYDKRLVERFIKRGEVTRADYQAHLQALPDVTQKSEPLVSADRSEQRDEGNDADDE